MSVTDKTERGQTDHLCFELELAHAPAKVWRAISTPELLARWLLPSDGFSAAVGTNFVLQAPQFPGWDGKVQCRVLEADAPKRLSYTWVVGDMELDTVVTFSLSPTESGTRLTVVQSGFQPAQKQNFGGARYGWKLMSDKLIQVLDELD